LTQGCGFVRYARETFTLGYVDQRPWRKNKKHRQRRSVLLWVAPVYPLQVTLLRHTCYTDLSDYTLYAQP
nr:hypothetical protein [Pirellula sp.]